MDAKHLGNGTKTPLIPPLLDSNQLATDFFVKENLLNIFFSQQCTTIVNNNFIPVNPTFETGNSLSTFEFSITDVVKFIEALDPKMPCGHDCMLYMKTVWKMNVSLKNGQKKM